MRSCKGRVHNEDSVMIKLIIEHNHAPCKARIDAVTIINSIKERAARSDEATRTISQQELKDLPKSSVSHLPSTRALQRVIQRHQEVPNPEDDIPIPEAFRRTVRNSEFSRREEEEEEERRM